MTGPRRLANFVRSLASSRRGNVAIITALVFPFLIVLGGGAIDFHRGYTAKAQAQDAIDLAAISAASSRTIDTDQLEGIAVDYLAGNIAGRLMNPNPTVEVHDPEVSGFRMTLSGSVDSIFLGLVGIPTMPVEVETVVERGTMETIELVLVLDNTWSMSAPAGGGVTKIAALKSASNVLVNALMANPDAAVKLGVVPYGDYVNVGTGNRGASWLSVPADISTTSQRVCTTITTRNVCTRGATKTCTRSRDGVVESYDCTPQTCRTEPVAPYQSCSGGTTTVQRWFGCVTSRPQGTHRLNDNAGFPYPGLLATSQNCLTAITPLTDRKATITAAINALVVNVGNYKPETYIPSGLMWGINVLSPTEPFSQGAAYGTNNTRPRKIMVLMTDGENTLRFNPSNGLHQAPSGGNAGVTQLAATNTDTTALCNYAKSKKIEVYTVALAVTSNTARNLLSACASEADNYFDVRDTALLEEAFLGIAASIYKVRIVS
ncbi:TadE/TadG family type IV pilus assembly protein [Brevundimonas variabilis]|uniref:Flp pilus assembly protein TadG n=1 Tax=Brevundimonas variabilis TaxID=74312 RepID=A0A7W9FER0_9CAUL|nr:TadE/TadG family type IV pilus assembly protein [Brevundimonas variabilis]MBB5744793.1 Flp pilus assembly protein TadG [Brevundimonas variabilis]